MLVVCTKRLFLELIDKLPSAIGATSSYPHVETVRLVHVRTANRSMLNGFSRRDEAVPVREQEFCALNVDESRRAQPFAVFGFRIGLAVIESI